MLQMIRYEIGIVETRNVIKTILDIYGFDFRDYALTSFKRRLEQIIVNNGLKDADGLIFRLQNYKDFLEQLLQEVTPETTEMFRDPSLWRTLRDEVIPEIVKGTGKPKIWLTSFDSGEELYSLAITLNEMKMLSEVQIFTSYLSDLTLEKIRSGRIDPKQMETNEANYVRFNGDCPFGNYFLSDGTALRFNTALIQDVNFIKQNTTFDNPPGGIRLSLFRNQTIYYNQLLQDKIMQLISNCLVAGGFLVLGAKESLDNTSANNKFTVLNELEKIYKRKTT